MHFQSEKYPDQATLIPKTRKRTKRYKQPKSKKVERCEDEIQDMIENLLDDLGLQYVHVPGDLQRYLRNKAPVKMASLASKAFKGMPDLLIFAKDGDGNKVLLLELKTEIGVVSQSQKAWAKGLNLKVAYGYEEAKEIILQFVE